MLFDTHCHLTHERLREEVPALIQRARDAGLIQAITIGTGISDGKACRKLAQAHPDFLHCSVGLDPFSCHEAGDAFQDELQQLDHLLSSGDFVALGEIGLDYHYQLKPHARQIDEFEQQLDLARQHDLPVIIHVREAHEDMLASLRRHPENRGIIHSFTGGPQEAQAYLALDKWMLSFNGICTFKNARAVAEAAVRCPNDHLLIETDSPYLSPVPKRGKRCEPSYVSYTAAFLAEQRAQRVDDITAWTCKNACQLFDVMHLWPQERPPWEQA